MRPDLLPTTDTVNKTISDLAGELGVSETTVRRRIEDGLLTAEKVGGTHFYRCRNSEIDRLRRDD